MRFHQLCQIFIHTCMQTALAFFYQHKDVRETGNVLNKDFANVCEWLIISCQFILVKIKLNTFFSVGEKPFRSLTYDYDRIT